MSFSGVLRAIRSSQSGNVFFALFGAVALVGVVGATSMQVMRGPVRSMSEVTKRTVAENNMIASSKLALLAATTQANDGDCDADGFVEPIPFENAGASPKPTGGGYLPATIGAAINDPWDTRYGYCVWDHGATTSGCGGGNYLTGANSNTGYAIAIISAGPDRTFNTTCSAYPSATALNKTPGSDDVVLGYTYAEAEANSGGLWNLQSGDPNTAEIAKNLEVKDSGGTTTFALDAQTGIGDFIGLTTGAIAAKGSNPLSITGGLKFDTAPVETGACTAANTDAFAFDTAGDKLIRCNGANWVAAGGSDNLGNHIATQNIQLGSYWLSGDGGNEGIQVNATGGVSTSGALTTGSTLGVGTNATVGGTLGVTGATNLSTLQTSGSITAGGNILLGTNWLSGDGGNEGIRVTAAGFVGIANPAPAYPLDVVGYAGLGGLRINGADAGYNQIFQSIAGKTLGITANGGTISFGQTSLQQVVVTPAGDVGIGQPVPTSKLHVAGTAKITGDLDMSSQKIVNLLDPTAAQDAASKAYVDARVAAGTGYVEADPQVATLNATKWCVANAGGTAIECTENTPAGGDNLGNHTATQALAMGTYRITDMGDPTAAQDAATKSYVDTTLITAADDLGSHVATQNLDMAGFNIENAGAISATQVSSSGAVSASQLTSAGVVKVGTQIGCGPSDEGAIRYSGGSPAFEYCDGGGTWLPFKKPQCQDDDAGECTLSVVRASDDPDLDPENVRCGENILGVIGTHGEASVAPFSFTDQTGVAISTLITSDILQVSGIPAGCNSEVVVTGAGNPQFQVCSNATCSAVIQNWTNIPYVISNTQYFRVRLTSAATGGTDYTALVELGATRDNWTVTTAGIDTTPNAFSFTDETNQALNTLNTSNIITISGINAPTSVTVSGTGSPQISINGGAWATSGTITNGQTLQVRLTTANAFTTARSATVNVGGVTDVWSVTTRAAANCSNTTISWSNCDAASGSMTHSQSKTITNTTARYVGTRNITCTDGTISQSGGSCTQNTKTYNVNTSTACINGFCDCVRNGQIYVEEPAKATNVCVNRKNCLGMDSFVTSNGVAGQTHCSSNGGGCWVNGHPGNLKCTSVTCTGCP